MSCNCKTKDIPSIRIGNDIEIRWAVYNAVEPSEDGGLQMEEYPVEGKNISVYFNSKYNRQKAGYVSLKGNIVYCRFYGKDQQFFGPYSVVLIENEGGDGMHTLDECKAFELVGCSHDTDKHNGNGFISVSTIELETIAQIGIAGEKIEIDEELSETSTNPVQNKAITTALNTKVDKVEGKGLSEMDFTRELKEKLEGLQNYNDKNIWDVVTAISGSLVDITSGGQPNILDSINDFENFLKGYTDKDNLSQLLNALEEKIGLADGELSEDDFMKINGQSVLGNNEITVDIYESNISDDKIAVTQDYGDIKKGMTLSELKGRSYDQLFDAILFPTVYPNMVSPSASLALQGYATLQEVDALAPTEEDFKKTFTRGKFTLDGAFQNYSCGALNESASFIYIDGKPTSKILPSAVKLGSTTYCWRAAYYAGETPSYTNKGDKVDNPLSAGYIDSNAITVIGTYPWYATTSMAANGEPVKQELVRWISSVLPVTTPEFTLLPTATCPQVISTPSEIKEIYIKDNNSGNFVSSNLNSFEKKTETRSGRTYYRYTYTGAARGEITLKIKF
jgi:hypothetical protein